MAETKGRPMAPMEDFEGIDFDRTLDAPLETVWRAWTDPERMKKWWGPKAFTAPVVKIDFRVGGKYLACMRAPDGKDYWSTGEYREIIPMRKIVATDSFSDENGNIVPGSYYGLKADYPLEMLLIVNFESLGDKTRLTMHHTGIPHDGEERKNAKIGWEETLDKLEEYLRSSPRT